MDPNRLSVFELKSALENSLVILPSTSNTDGTPSKMNPLKTTKQRNTSNNHRKNQQRSTTSGGRNNSTDEDIRGEHSHIGHASIPISSSLLRGDDGEEFRKSEGDNENTTNNDEQSGFVDSENDTIAERLCSLSKLSLHNNVVVAEEERHLRGHFSGIGASSTGCGTGFNSGGAPQSSDFSSHSVPISKVRNPSYPAVTSLIESDSISEAPIKNHFIPVQSSSGCPGATTGDGDGFGETMDDSSGRRFRRRRRRRGHNTTKKRIAVDVSVADNNEGVGEEMKLSGYPMRHSERPGPSGISHKKFNKLGKILAPTDPLLDSFGMKRKRTIATVGSALSVVPDIESDAKLGDMDMGDVGNLSLNSPEMVDQEMKSDDEEDDDCSSCDSVDEAGEDDRGREADDEQSDWVFDEWSNSNSSKAKEESATSRKKRLLKMLRSYNDMISANVGGGGPLNSSYQIPTREIRAGKRRVFISKPGFPTKGIWTSANEEVSKFLQDPLQSQIRLQPISAEESVQLSHLASLYSLRMDYCNTPGEEPSIGDIALAVSPLPENDDGDSTNPKLIPVLTKTPNTTQMDKISSDPLTVSSPFNANAEGSSSSNVSSVYGPTYSDVDSRTSDSKRIKK